MRRVVVSSQLFMILDSLLPAARGGDRLSRDDFIRLELLLANPTHPAYKTLISRGELVPSYAITGRLLPDGTIELIDISIDFDFDMGLLDPPPKTERRARRTSDDQEHVTHFMTRNAVQPCARSA